MPSDGRAAPNPIPGSFVAALGLAGTAAALVAIDQSHWWSLKPDYAFGWLVPLFVAYVVFERWPKIRDLFGAPGPHHLPPWASATLSLSGTGLLTAGLLLFLMGAAYRAGSGVSQPGSLVLALGLSLTVLGLMLLHGPRGQAGADTGTSLVGRLAADGRLRLAALFVFPALIWVLSAPLVTAVENAISLFLLRRVVEVVFFVFNLLGLPLVQQGNVLLLPKGTVGVADACSGIRSLTGCLFAGSFIAAIFLDKGWKKLLLVAAAMVLAFFTNLLRSLFLTGWAYAKGSNSIEGAVHDYSGYAVLGLTTIGLFCLLPLFSSRSPPKAGPSARPARL